MPTHAARRWSHAGWTGVAALVLALAVASPAWAHAQLISMSPANGSTVTVAPARVVLTFDEAIQHVGDAIVVTAPDGTRVDHGPPEIQGPTASETLLPLTVAGHYTVSYRVVSDDGHPVTSILGFDFTAGGAAVSTPSPSVAATATEGSSGRLWLGVTVVLAIALACAFGVLRRRGRRS